MWPCLVVTAAAAPLASPHPLPPQQQGHTEIPTWACHLLHWILFTHQETKQSSLSWATALWSPQWSTSWSWSILCGHALVTLRRIISSHLHDRLVRQGPMMSLFAGQGPEDQGNQHHTCSDSGHSLNQKAHLSCFPFQHHGRDTLRESPHALITAISTAGHAPSGFWRFGLELCPQCPLCLLGELVSIHLLPARHHLLQEAFPDPLACFSSTTWHLLSYDGSLHSRILCKCTEGPSR